MTNEEAKALFEEEEKARFRNDKRKVNMIYKFYIYNNILLYNFLIT